MVLWIYGSRSGVKGSYEMETWDIENMARPRINGLSQYWNGRSICIGTWLVPRLLPKLDGPQIALSRLSLKAP